MDVGCIFIPKKRPVLEKRETSAGLMRKGEKKYEKNETTVEKERTDAGVESVVLPAGTAGDGAGSGTGSYGRSGERAGCRSRIGTSGSEAWNGRNQGCW